VSRRKPLPTTHRLGKPPDFANSSRFHSAPFQRQPVNRSTGPRFYACRAVTWRRRIHSVPPSQIAEDRLPCRHERVSFRQAPSAGRPRIRACLKIESGSCGRGFWLWPRRQGPRIPNAGCKGRANEGHRQKTRRPEGSRVKSALAALLIPQRPLRVRSLLAPCQTGFSTKTGPL